MELLDHMTALFKLFRGIFMTVSYSNMSIYIPPTAHRVDLNLLNFIPSRNFKSPSDLSMDVPISSAGTQWAPGPGEP